MNPPVRRSLRYIIENVRLFDGEKYFPRPCTVHVSDGLISYVGDYERGKIYVDNATVISAEGCMLLPGLIDAHTHVFRAIEGVKRCVPMGITTIMDMHNEPDHAAWMKEQCRSSTRLPDLLSAFLAATIQDGWSRPIMRRHTQDEKVLAWMENWPTLDTPESVEKYVVKNKSLGADFIKLMQESGECLNFEPINAPTQELQAAVVDSAHRHGLLTVAHATNLRETLLVLRAGVDGLAHQFFDRPHTDELIQEYKKRGAFVIPTLTAVNSFNGTKSSTEFSADERVARVLDETTKHCLCHGMNIALQYCNVQFAYDCIRDLKKAGIDIVCGTDSGVGFHGSALGISVHHELSMYVDHCGFSPVEALRSATSVTARRYSLADRGRVMAGLIADLVLVRGNPTEVIRDTLNIEKVWKRGVLYEEEQM